AREVPVEVRGAGSATRQVNNLADAVSFECRSLIVVEVLTPGGNWSSYPPHKHDEHRPDETELEEIYYFEVARGGAGYQRVYTSGPDREIDVLAEVRSGDVVLVPHGWHGPSMAAPGYDLYYLNVMAGPGDRAWRFRDDPAHAWIRDTWADQPIDPRVPFYGRPA
ncbi:MAG TPA: 5-deoxy-glucuronate isomerase, partial [Asanoa sp.]|nr:5-deoxy-glucuronate isomerase [Asanoa sp.]